MQRGITAVRLAPSDNSPDWGAIRIEETPLDVKPKLVEARNRPALLRLEDDVNRASNQDLQIGPTSVALRPLEIQFRVDDGSAVARAVADEFAEKRFRSRHRPRNRCGCGVFVIADELENVFDGAGALAESDHFKRCAGRMPDRAGRRSSEISGADSIAGFVNSAQRGVVRDATT